MQAVVEPLQSVSPARVPRDATTVDVVPGRSV